MCYNLGGTMYHDLQRFSFHEKKINQLKVDEAYTVCNLKVDEAYTVCNLKVNEAYTVCNLKVNEAYSL